MIFHLLGRGFHQALAFATADAGGGAADDKGAADKAAADAAAATKAADDKAAADKAVADKATADKAAADKLSADAAAAAAASKGGKPGDGQPGKDGAALPKPKAPTDYTLTLPNDGLLRETDLPRIRAMAEINGWTEEQTQHEIDVHTASIKLLDETFLAEARTDPEYGGSKLERTQTLAARAIARVRPEGHPRTEAFMDFLARNGAKNNIEVLAFLADFGKLMGEDVGLTDGHVVPGAGDVDAAQKLYGGTKYD